ncbi:MAG: FecR domain-containing protein [Bryobacterales bacterium]|nr:FecR domain-containing protein [Bryobacterales bacterium]
MPEDRLEKLLNEMREETVPTGEVTAATARVWNKIAGDASPLCAEFQADLEAYRAGALETSRRLLVEDHLGRCPACRRVLAGEPATPRSAPVRVMPRRVLPAWSRWAIAAGLAAAALYLGRDRIDAALAPSGPRATVASLRGDLYRLPGGTLTAGSTLNEGETVRTGLGARAVLRLRDGSLVEVNERTELSVHAAWSGQSIQLARGDLIVQAARQRRGRLRVDTQDTSASVKGTVFTVSSGLAGSLVSVVEGAVQVRQGGTTRLLTRGQLAASSRALGEMPVSRTLAWSENASKYYALLGEFAKIEAAVAASGIPAPRTEPKLLRYLPADAVLYLAVPNPGPLAKQITELVGQRSAESAVLRDWWNSSRGENLKQLLGRVQALAPILGDEVVLVATRQPASVTPAFLAEVQPGQQEALKQALSEPLHGDLGAVHISGGLVVLSDSRAHLDSILSRLGHGAASPFASEIAAHYQNGVDVLCVWDAAATPPSADKPGGAAAFLGADKLKYVSFQQGPVGGSEESQASLLFSGPRTGAASWLATPAAAGSAEYVSAAAVAAVSASTRNPEQAFDELVTLIGRINPKFPQELAEVESRAGVRVGGDIAAALGTDFTFSIERPTLPIPGWVAIVEVNQPAVLDSAVRRLADAANREAAAAGATPRLIVEDQQAEGRAWTVLRLTNINLTLSWTYDRGYWVMSTDRALAAAAIATRAGGFPLVRSAQFVAQLPASAGLHQSAFLWLNTQGPLADMLAAFGGEAAKTLLQSREPVLVVVNGEGERIQAASRTRLMSMLLTMMLTGQARAGQIGNAAGSATH